MQIQYNSIFKFNSNKEKKSHVNGQDKLHQDFEKDFNQSQS